MATVFALINNYFMKAIITPFAQTQAGIAVFKVDQDTALLLQRGARFVIEPLHRELHDRLPDGLFKAPQSLASVAEIEPFFSDDSVFAAAGGKAALRAWLGTGKASCQSSDDEYHSPEVRVSSYGGSMARLCWHHDNHYTASGHDDIAGILKANRASFIMDRVGAELQIPAGRDISIPELCWWATLRGVHSALTEDMCRISIARHREDYHSGVMLESAIMPKESASEVVEKMAARVSVMTIDADPPLAYMRNPKVQLVRSQAFIDYTLSRPCCGCGKKSEHAYQAEHRVLDRHDLYVVPMCDYCYRQYSKDPAGWSASYGSLLSHWMKHFNRAMNVGAIKCE